MAGPSQGFLKYVLHLLRVCVWGQMAMYGSQLSVDSEYQT